MIQRGIRPGGIGHPLLQGMDSPGDSAFLSFRGWIRLGIQPSSSLEKGARVRASAHLTEVRC